MNLTAHGIALDLPPGWEGSITTTSDDRGKSDGGWPILHLSTAPLPPNRGDYGSGAVETLTADDAFISLVEFGPDCAGTALFSRAGMPRQLGLERFNRRALQRTIAGQCGQQVFFTDGGRAFCLFVVLGRDHDIAPLVDRVNAALGTIRIGA